MTKRSDHHPWTQSFIRALKNCGNDPICVRISSDGTYARKIAGMVRPYVDKNFTRRLNRDRKVRVTGYRKKLDKAIAGLEIASKLHVHRDPEKAASLDAVASDLRAEKERAKQLLRTKRHGRDRDHGLLDLVQRELEEYFSQPITWATLASIVNAGLEADGQDKLVDEVLVRKNLTAFRKANPHWTQLVWETKPS